MDSFGERLVVGISTGIEIQQSLSDDILAAKEKGQEVMDDFIQKRLEEYKPQTNFFDPILKMKLATFSFLHKPKICKTKNKVIALKSSEDLFGKIAIIARKRSVDMRSHEQVITKLLLFGNEKLKVAQNKSILTSTIEFL